MTTIRILTGRVSHIDEMKSSRNPLLAFRRVYFQMKDEKNSTPEKKAYFWAKTDLVPTFRNYPRWQNLIKPGNVLSGLRMKTDNTVDADSVPVLIGNLEREPEIGGLQKSLWK